MKRITDTLSESRPVRHGAGFHRLRSFADAEVASQLQFARWPSTTNVAISSRNSGVYFCYFLAIDQPFRNGSYVVRDPESWKCASISLVANYRKFGGLTINI
jgi:hypothetical protein